MRAIFIERGCPAEAAERRRRPQNLPSETAFHVEGFDTAPAKYSEDSRITARYGKATLLHNARACSRAVVSSTSCKVFLILAGTMLA